MKPLVTVPESTSSGQTLDESMVPAINIVFLLLIFFMIAGQFGVPSITAPVPESGAQDSLTPSEHVLYVLGPNEYQLDSRSVQTSVVDALHDLGEPKDIELIIAVDRSLPTSVLDPVLRASREAGLQRVLIATETTR
ncbi:ExbD/TolR family protein [Reinekea blandensis]|uniref:Biopolymer transporter ExbD n=1 Tax=Reinekea blandensis MED297 TaxID=314283 RepID=A4BA51_9GAMM|nr:biopolymer transporter ExbD [Reinekea blandensis]EAR10807.1 hypothetical protein MED297_09866 [Reinekea sp. MED297] [Reinekea blandensis MED297]